MAKIIKASRAELGSRGSLRCWAADIHTGGMKSKSPCSRRNSQAHHCAIDGTETPIKT